MNQQQKDAIHELRAKGQSYTKIAGLLAISENTIQSYCRRNTLGGAALSVAEPVNGMFCKMCGAPLMQTLGKKQKRFCSDKCRMAWWNAHPEAVKHQKVNTFTCQSCGKQFQGYGNRARKYCSLVCYSKGRAVKL